MLLNWGVVRLAAVVYFVQGALGIAGIALPLYLRAQGFSVSKIAFISSVAAIPWFLKPIYGAISDFVPIGHLRRRPYLFIYCICSSLGWIFLSMAPPDEKWLILSMMFANLGFAATDVITDGLVVEYSRPGTVQTYQSIAWGARSIGSVLSGFTGGILAAKLTAQNIFIITGFLPLVSILAIIFLREKKAPSKWDTKNIPSHVWESICKLWRVLKGDLKWFLIFIFIISTSSAFGLPLFFYMRETLQFDEIFLGLLSSVTWAGAMVGCFLFLTFFQKVRLKKALYWAISIGFIEILMTLLIKDAMSAFLISFLLGVLGYNVLLPLFSSAARLAHGTGVEGLLYAILMSLFNVGQAVSSSLGGRLYDWVGLETLIILTALFALTAFLVIPRLKTL
jgi:predicted MFS family arabinose efflux permease